tara:strand:+ start:725 stop:2251 length:1527 start_codon:yes stop_codon:yes gene_type:complete
MYRLTPVSLGVALPALLLSSAAWADLTPAQVWGDWQQYLQGMGYDVTATEATNGDTLTISDLTINFPAPQNNGSVTMTVGAIDFSQNNDGTVAVVMPASLPLTIAANDNGTEPDFTMDLNYTQSDHSMTVSGTPEAMTYDYNAATIGLTMAKLIVDDKTYGAENARIDIAGTGLISSTTMTVGEMRGYEQDSKIAALTYDVFVKNPQESGQLELKGGMSDLDMQGTGMIPLEVSDAADMAAMIKAGFDVSGKFSYNAGTSILNFQDPRQGAFASATSSENGELSVAMGPGGVSYAGTQDGLTMSVKVANLPFPIDLSMANGGFNLAMPVVKSDEPQDFAFGLTLGDFVMSDMIWGIFDPANQLPRDPATIDLDLTGKAKLLVDVLDPNAATQFAGPPGEMDTLTVNTLVVDAVGARLEGQGDIKFDNTDKTTFPGMPKPVGTVNLLLAGGNTLLDKLVAMGLFPQDQAMGARMMMGLFAVPGTAPDTLNSKIEFTQDGQVLANGQRIK